MTKPIPIPAADQTWLHMDRPNNLMHIHGLMEFAQPPDWQAMREVVQERLVEKYPVFSRRPAQHDSGWVWEPDPAFSLDNHLRRVVMPEGSGIAELREHVSRGFSVPLTHDVPLWDFELIENVTMDSGATSSFMFSRFHHALADGIRSVQLLLSLCDIEGDPTPAAVGRRDSSGSLTAALRRTTHDVADLAKGVASGLVRLPVTMLHPKSFYQGLDLVIHPTHMIDAVAALANEANATVNTLAESARVLIAPRSVETSWSGTPDVEKRVDWVAGLPLNQVKEIGRRHKATVNDVMLATVSRAMSRYLMEHGEMVDEISWLVPVSLVPQDLNLPEELGNHFSLVFLPMPLGIESPDELFEAIRVRMSRIKNSAEPVITFGVQNLIAQSPKAVAVGLTNLFANKGVGVLTNVPGPRTHMDFAGSRVTNVFGWAPTSGDQPLSLCIYSYAGHVSVGIAADAALIPDPGRMANLIREEFEVLSRA